MAHEISIFFFLENINSPIYKNNMFPGCSQIFLGSVEAFWYNKMSKYGLLRVQKSRNHEKRQIFISKIMKSGFYCTNPKRNKTIKPLTLIFKQYYDICCPKMTIIIMIFRPMNFL